MDAKTAAVIEMNLAKLSREEVEYLHDLKAKAVTEWAERELKKLRGKKK